MSRRANRENSGEASLFPFLAVLLCTMGALVTLLVVMAAVSKQVAQRQHTAAQAAADVLVVVDAATRAENDERIAQLDELKKLHTMADVRIAEVDAAQRRQQAKMQTVEDHLQRLHSQYLAMRDVARELEAMEEGHFDDRDQAEQELARLKQLADDYRKQVADAKANANKPTSFAVVPYEGPNGTHRRPVYIECRVDRVILQPEGIELTAKDFNLEMGADSALAAAVRAAQRYYESETADPQDRPYPLILVRPDGVFSYLHVRNVLEEWDAEFGYELVDADWQLDFGVADPVLAERKQLAVMQSRVRAEALAQAAPGIMQAGAIDSFEPPGIRNRSQVRGNGNEPGGSLLGGFGSVAGSGTSDGSPATSGDSGSGSEKSIAELLGGTGTGNLGGDGQATGDESADREPGLAASETGESGTTTTDAFASVDGGTTGGDDPNAATQQNSGELTGNPVAAASGQASGTVGAKTAGGGGQEGDGAATASTTAGATPSAMTANRSGVAGQGQTEETSNGFAVVRPVRIIASGDRVLVVPDTVRDLRFIPPSAQAKAIEVSRDPRPMMAELRTQLQSHITGWGMAGAGLRWKPRIELTVVPGGERSAELITRAANESGIEVSTPSANPKQASANQQEVIDAATTR